MEDNQSGTGIPSDVKVKSTSLQHFAPVRWLWALIPAVLFFTMGYRYACPNYAQSLGYLILYVVILNYVFWKFFFRHPKKSTFWLLLICFMCVGITGSSMGAARHPNNPHAAIYPKGQSGLIPTTVDDVNAEDLRVVKEFWKTFGSDAEKIQQDYTRDKDESGIANLWSPEWLKAHPDLPGIKDALGKCRESYALYKKRSTGLWDGVEKRGESLAISDANKKDVLASFRQSRQDAMPVLAAIYRNQEDTLVEIDAIVNVLSNNKGKWDVQNGRLHFASRSVEDTFSLHLEKLMRLEKQLKKLH